METSREKVLFSLRTFTGISVSWTGFSGFNLCNSLIISYYLLITLMLGWFVYLSMPLKVDCGIVSDKGLQYLNFIILRLVIILEKKK